MSRKSLPAAALLVIVVVAAVAVIVWINRLNAPPVIDMTNVIFEEDYQLTGTLDGDAVVFGTRITLDANSIVNGDLSLVGETVVISGVINGDLAIVASEIQFSGAHISGDTVMMGNKIAINGRFDGDFSVTGESITIEPTSAFNADTNVCGDVLSDPLVFVCQDETVFAPLEALIRLRSDGLSLDSAITPPAVIAVGALMTGIMAGITSLSVAVFPRQFSRIEDAVRTTPRRLFGVGLAVFGLGIGLTLALVVLIAMLPPVGFVLIPIYLAVGLGLLALMISGWVTLALVIGERVIGRAPHTSRSHRGVPPMLIAAVGSVILSAVLTLLALLPFGSVITAITLAGVTAAGVGGAMLTRLGTRPLSRATFVQG